MTAPPPARRGVVARGATSYRTLLARQRRLERRLERRYPKLYDARHAATFPDVEAPGWLRAVGDALAAVFSVIGPAAKYLALACAALLGVYKTREVRRKRIAAEQIGRPELQRRLAVTLGAVESSARAQGAATVEDASVQE